MNCINCQKKDIRQKLAEPKKNRELIDETSETTHPKKKLAFATGNHKVENQ